MSARTPTRRPGLMAQVLLANLLLVGAGVGAALVASNPSVGADAPLVGLILGFALAISVGINFLVIQSRIQPLEELTREMQDIDPRHPQAPDVRAWPRSTPSEVTELTAAFAALLERIADERRLAARAALAAGERERERVARDLHDEVNQALTALLLRLGAVRGRAPAELQPELAEIGRIADQAMGELLSLARQLRPAVLDDLGLVAALSSLVDELNNGSQARIEIAIEHGARRDAGLSREHQLVVYRIAQEALANAVRHSGGSTVSVRLGHDAEGRVELTVEDDGRGLPAGARPRRGHGLTGMRERADLAGGELEIGSGASGGVRVRLALDAHAQDAPLAEEMLLDRGVAPAEVAAPGSPRSGAVSAP